MARPSHAPPVPAGTVAQPSLSTSRIGVGARAVDLGCVVLCGGRGTRLAGVVSDRPKSMVPVAGRPFLEWLLLSLRAQGVTSVTLATGHLGDRILDELGDGAALGMRLTHSREEAPLGTGGALRLALDVTAGRRVLVLNGDTYCRLDLDRLLTTHDDFRARATLQLAHVEDAGRYGAVQVTDAGLVTAFAEKRSGDAGWVSTGVYLLERSVVEAIAPGAPVSMETGVLPGLAGNGLRALAGTGPFVDIGTPESLASASDVLGDELAGLASSPPAPAAELVRRRLGDTVAVQQAVIAHCAGDVVEAARLITNAYARGDKLLLCGNGGSAGDCQHVAAELMSRLRGDVERRALPAIALTTDSSFLTAFANDYGYDDVFARQVEGLGRRGDVLLGISTSGGSVNVLRAFELARSRGVTTIALTGAGGTMAEVADVAIQVPSGNTRIVQECMLSIEHILCELVEDRLFARRDLGREPAVGGAPDAR